MPLQNDEQYPILTSLINSIKDIKSSTESNYEKAMESSEALASLEIVDARNGEASLKARIDKLNILSRLGTNFNCIVSFIDDDCYTSFLTKLKPIYDANSIKCTLASVPYYVTSNDANAMTLAQLKQLKSEGYEIVSHSGNHSDLGTLNDADLDNEIKIGYDFMTANGFNPDIIVYPFKGYDERVRNVVKKYHKCAVETTNAANGTNGSPIETFNLKRYTMDFTPIADLKTLADWGLRDKAWVIFWSHSWDTNCDANRVDQIIKYVKSKNIPIMTVGEALPYFANPIELGDKDSNYFFVSRSGKVDSNTAAAPLAPATPTFSYTPTTRTDTNVTVTITYAASATVKQYKIGTSGTYQNYTAPFTVSANTTIYAKCQSSSGTWSNEANLVISNIGALTQTTVTDLLSYNTNTWTEWTTNASTITKDSTGTEITQQTGGFFFHKGTSLLPSTKYGYLFTVVSNNFPSTSNSFIINSFNNAQSADLQINDFVGNMKFVNTSPATITNNQLEFASTVTPTAGLKIKLKDVRIFELPSGSQVEYDFENLTADALNTKYAKVLTTTQVDTTPPTISLSVSPTTATSGNVTITVTATDTNGIAAKKWALGTQTTSYFTSSGTVLSGTTFDVSTNGTYTVYAKDTNNNEAVQTITISNITGLTQTTVTNLLTYTPSTWAEWQTNATGITKDITGVEITQQSGNIWFHKGTSLSPNTKYGYLMTVVSNNIPSTTNSFFLNSWNNAQSTDWQINNATGNIKFIDTSPASITTNQIEFATTASATVGTKIKFKDIRIFALPSGSQVEYDFNNLTADALNTKYPY